MTRTPALARPPARSDRRLVRLYLISRQAPVAVTVLAACGLALAVALHWQWIRSNRPAAQQVPLIIETATATAIAVVTRSPFGEPERAAGRWLPYLRLVMAVALTAAAIGALAAGSAAGRLPGGATDVTRNVAGLTGVGLLSAAGLGGALAWVGPMTYLMVAEYALNASWTTPWLWAARPAHDHGAAVCASLAFCLGAIAITVGGARDSLDKRS